MSHGFKNQIKLASSIRNQTFNCPNKDHKIGDSTLETVIKNIESDYFSII